MKWEISVGRPAHRRISDVASDLGARRIRILVGICLLELYAVWVYFALTTASPAGELRYLVYPFLWINVGVWAVYRADVRPGIRRERWIAGTIATAYFVALLWVPGQVGLGTAATGSLVPTVDQVRIAWHVPGWGPILAVDGALRMYLVPFEVVGYASIAYLAYANLVAATRGVLAGVLGLATCVGCTVPILVPLLGLVGGPATGLASTATAWSYDAGTAIFLLTVALLFWSHRRAQR